jgi:hypothetical protein
MSELDKKKQATSVFSKVKVQKVQQEQKRDYKKRDDHSPDMS